MKIRILGSVLGLAALLVQPAVAMAGLFGCCCKKCCLTICCRPYNAFDPICCGTLNCFGCCPWMGCGQPACPPMGPPCEDPCGPMGFGPPDSPGYCSGSGVCEPGSLPAVNPSVRPPVAPHPLAQPPAMQGGEQPPAGAGHGPAPMPAGPGAVSSYYRYPPAAYGLVQMASHQNPYYRPYAGQGYLAGYGPQTGHGYYPMPYTTGYYPAPQYPMGYYPMMPPAAATPSYWYGHGR